MKDIRDKRRAIEMHVHHPQNTETEEQARDIRPRVERKCGQVLRGEIHGGDQRSRSAVSSLQLADLYSRSDQSIRFVIMRSPW
jgi:hypothetical protein